MTDRISDTPKPEDQALKVLETTSGRVVNSLYPIVEAMRERLVTLQSLETSISPRRLTTISDSLGEAADIIMRIRSEIDALAKDAGYEISFGGELIHLTADENTIWDIMSQQPNQSFSTVELKDLGFADEEGVNVLAVRHALKGLTHKLQTPDSPVKIEASGQTRSSRYTLIHQLEKAPVEKAAEPIDPFHALRTIERAPGKSEVDTIRDTIRHGIDRLLSASPKPLFTQRELIFTAFGRMRVDVIEHELIKEIARNDPRLIASWTEHGQEYSIPGHAQDSDWVDKELLAEVADATLKNMITYERREYSFGALHAFLQSSRGLFLTSKESLELQAILAADPRVQSVSARGISVNLATLPKALRPAQKPLRTS